MLLWTTIRVKTDKPDDKMPVPEGTSATKIHFINTGIDKGKIVGIAEHQRDRITVPQFQSNGCDIGTLRFICNTPYETLVGYIRGDRNEYLFEKSCIAEVEKLDGTIERETLGKYDYYIETITVDSTESGSNNRLKPNIMNVATIGSATRILHAVEVNVTESNRRYEYVTSTVGHTTRIAKNDSKSRDYNLNGTTDGKSMDYPSTTEIESTEVYESSTQVTKVRVAKNGSKSRDYNVDGATDKISMDYPSTTEVESTVKYENPRYNKTNVNEKSIMCNSEEHETGYIYIVCVVLGIVVIIMLLIMMSIVKYYRLVRKERYQYLVRTLEFTGRHALRNQDEIALTRL